MIRLNPVNVTCARVAGPKRDANAPCAAVIAAAKCTSVVESKRLRGTPGSKPDAWLSAAAPIAELTVVFSAGPNVMDQLAIVTCLFLISHSPSRRLIRPAACIR